VIFFIILFFGFADDLASIYKDLPGTVRQVSYYFSHKVELFTGYL